MRSLLFGTAGIPRSTNGDTSAGIAQVRKLGLDAMEMEFVRSVHISEKKIGVVRDAAKKHDVTLTCHGQYWVNLNAKESAKLQASRERVLHAADVAFRCGAWSICYHAAYYMKDAPAVAYTQVKREFKALVQQLQDKGNTIWLRAETAGKLTQWGSLREVIQLSQDVEQVMPVIDWGHLHAYSNGKVNTAQEFRDVLTQLESGLGREGLENAHFHMEGIAYSEKGERAHLEIAESDINYQDMIAAWKEFRVKGVVISESPNIEKDALLMQQEYRKA